ncbi:hypothetical protein ACTXT7_015649, partial [Hymenolepis weldensis]
DSGDTVALRERLEGTLSQLDNTLAENTASVRTSATRLNSGIPSMVNQMSIPERTPTPPPLLSPPISLSRRPTSVPLFNHSSELSHHYTNNSGLTRLGDSVSYIVNSPPRLCETLNRPEIRIRSSIPGLHTRSLLAVAEAEERALRERLDSLQIEMEKEVESEANEATTSVNTSTSETISQVEDKLSSTINFYTTATNSDSNEKMYPKFTVIGEDSLKVRQIELFPVNKNDFFALISSALIRLPLFPAFRCSLNCKMVFFSFTVDNSNNGPCFLFAFNYAELF